MKIEISICTGLMLNDHSNPYIESTTVLSDIIIIYRDNTAVESTVLTIILEGRYSLASISRKL